MNGGLMMAYRLCLFACSVSIKGLLTTVCLDAKLEYLCQETEYLQLEVKLEHFCS